MIPCNDVLQIHDRRGFHDVPRLFLAGSDAAGFWILESEFDDVEDEYSDTFLVYAAGRSFVEAAERFERHCQGDRRDSAGMIAVARVAFDATVRANFTIEEA